MMFLSFNNTAGVNSRNTLKGMVNACDKKQIEKHLQQLKTNMACNYLACDQAGQMKNVFHQHENNT